MRWVVVMVVKVGGEEAMGFWLVVVMVAVRVEDSGMKGLRWLMAMVVVKVGVAPSGETAVAMVVVIAALLAIACEGKVPVHLMIKHICLR